MGTDTVFCDQFDPGLPVSPALCRVYGNLWDINGQPEPGVIITASLPNGITRMGSVIITANPVVTTTDSLGCFFIDLIPSNSLEPSGIEYEITFSRPDGGILRERVFIPDLTSWRMAW